MISENFLYNLFDKLKIHAKKDPKDSYTSFILNSGAEKIAKKVSEEAFEVAIASLKGENHKSDKNQIINESADLIYHLMLLMISRGVELRDVINEMKERSKEKI